MKLIVTLAVLGIFASFHAFAATIGFDPTSINIPGPDAATTLHNLTADLRVVFDKFEPNLDSTIKIVVPLKVSGTASQPEVTISVQKCVLLTCETIMLDGLGSIQEISGTCADNYSLTIDLSRSSPTLSENYDRLNGDICFQKNPDGSGTLSLNSSVRQAAQYQPGFVQEQELQMLKMQIPAISSAIQKAASKN